MTGYEVWSFESGNMLADTDTLEEAVEWMRGLRDANPEYDYWEHWHITEWFQNGTQTDIGRKWDGDDLKALVDG